jgi:hypothetical protein
MSGRTTQEYVSGRPHFRNATASEIFSYLGTKSGKNLINFYALSKRLADKYTLLEGEWVQYIYLL